MEAEKFLDMLPVSWRSREAKVLGAWSSDIQEEGTMDVPAPEERRNSPFLYTFALPGPQWVGGCLPTLVRVDFLYSVY